VGYWGYFGSYWGYFLEKTVASYEVENAAFKLYRIAEKSIEKLVMCALYSHFAFRPFCI
jgi:hypothetical protein